MDDQDREKIKIYEEYQRGDLTKNELRELLGEDVLEAMKNEREAFESAMELDTSDLLTSDDQDA